MLAGPLPDLLARLDRGGLDDRCETLAAIGRLGAAAGPAVPRLIDLFDSREIRGPGSSSFGPTGNDPGRDFVVALAAVDALVQIGEPAHAPILEILRRAGANTRRYHAMLAAGRLGLAAAIPYLEATIAAQDSLSVRVNFDQCEEYPLADAALAALRALDRGRAIAHLDRVIRTGAPGRWWAVHTLIAAADAEDAADTLRGLLADEVLTANERAFLAARGRVI